MIIGKMILIINLIKIILTIIIQNKFILQQKVEADPQISKILILTLKNLLMKIFNFNKNKILLIIIIK